MSLIVFRHERLTSCKMQEEKKIDKVIIENSKLQKEIEKIVRNPRQVILEEIEKHEKKLKRYEEIRKKQRKKDLSRSR